MADNMKIERVVDSAGRRMETRVFENSLDGNKKERVVETHVEQIPLAISERVVEEIVPIVTSRKKETFDKDGKVVDTVHEELDRGGMKMGVAKPDNSLTREDLRMVLREIAAVRSEAPAAPAPAEVVAPTPPPAPCITKDDLKEVLAEVVKLMPNPAPAPTPAPAPYVHQHVTPVHIPPTPTPGGNNKVWEFVEVCAYVVLSGELAFCLYQLVLKNWL